MFNLDDKEYDESKMSEAGQIALSQIQIIKKKTFELDIEKQNLKVLSDYYFNVLKNNLPLDDEEECIPCKEAKDTLGTKP